jgi:pimeloyl-ACP methyl ester carboxylesterase
MLSAKLANFRSGKFLKVEKKQHDLIFKQWDAYFAGVRRRMAPDDQRILSEPEALDLYRANRLESYTQGAGCMLQEIQALYSDPEIDLARLSACTVQIIHGTDDRTVPISVPRYLNNRIPGSRLTELPGRGHYFLYDENEMETILRGLLAAHRNCSPAVIGEQDSIAAADPA